MNKQIIHFGQDLDKAEFYNLIVKVTDINSQDLSIEIRDELLTREFTILMNFNLSLITKIGIFKYCKNSKNWTLRAGINETSVAYTLLGKNTLLQPIVS